MKKTNKLKYQVLYLFIAYFIGISFVLAQTEEQKALEQKRMRLQKEIREINRLLLSEKKEKDNVLDQMDALDQKIVVRQQLIRITNQETNLLNRHIGTNIRNISKLRSDLKTLKDEYARLIRKSYQNHLQQGRLMFLLSSESFFQAFKRMQFMKQYAEYRHNQGKQLVEKEKELTQLNTTLAKERKEKEALLIEIQKGKDALLKEIKTQKTLLASIRQNESKYAKAIENKTKEAKRIDRQIEKLIKEAILAANKAENGKNNNAVITGPARFLMTPEATVVAKNFSANKGRLIWPVETGLKSQGFGVYRDPVYPGLKHESNGVIINTEEGSNARSIFTGEVIAIISVPGGNKGVQVKHGNYISTYYNLTDLFVKKGDKVKAKTPLGQISTNAGNGQTKLKFYLYQNTNKLNPEEWIYQL